MTKSIGSQVRRGCFTLEFSSWDITRRFWCDVQLLQLVGELEQGPHTQDVSKCLVVSGKLAKVLTYASVMV